MSDSFLYVPRPPVAGAPSVVAPSNVVVQAQAVFQILDHALRNDTTNSQRAVGVILGVRSDDGSEVEIRSAFGIPHTEQDEGALIGTDHLKALYTLHRKAYTRDSIVGWYSTNTELSTFSGLMQELVMSNPEGLFSQPPIHLTVPTYELTQSSGEKKLPKDISVNTYLSSSIGSRDDKNVGNFFTPIPNEIRFSEIERSGLDSIAKARDDPSRTFSLINDIQALESTLIRISEMLDRVSVYVDGVIENSKTSGAAPAPGSVAIGKYLYKTLSLVPSISKENLEKLFNSHLQDVLMVVYLANTVQTQLQLSSRLTPIV